MVLSHKWTRNISSLTHPRSSSGLCRSLLVVTLGKSYVPPYNEEVASKVYHLWSPRSGSLSAIKETHAHIYFRGVQHSEKQIWIQTLPSSLSWVFTEHLLCAGHRHCIFMHPARVRMSVLLFVFNRGGNCLSKTVGNFLNNKLITQLLHVSTRIWTEACSEVHTV